MPGSELSGSRRVVSARAFAVGFVVGLVVTVPAILFALLSPVGEALLPLLTPGSLLLRPIAEAMADWPGLLNVGLVSVANGLIYGLVAMVLVRVAGLLRR